MAATIQKLETMEIDNSEPREQPRTFNLTREEIDAALCHFRAIEGLLRKLVDDNGHASQNEEVEVNWIDTGRALAISKRTPSWLYRNARKYGFGHRLPSGSWSFDEKKLRAFLTGKRDQDN